MKNTAVLIRVLLLVGLACFQLLIVLLAVAMIQENVLWPGIVVLFPLEAAVIVFGIAIFHTVPVVTLEEEGVYVRKAFHTDFFPWDCICQAGYQWMRVRGSKYKDLVLLPVGGSPRREQDKTFSLRNAGKLIHLPVSQEVRLFVEQHYGPLDFDQSDGQTDDRTA